MIVTMLFTREWFEAMGACEGGLDAAERHGLLPALISSEAEENYGGDQ